MNQFNRTVGVQSDTDLGLKSFMLGTYRYMAMAMGVTATVAYFVGQAALANPAILGFIYSPVVAIGAFFVIIFGFGAVGKRLPSMSLGGVQAFLFGFAAFMGVLMSAYAAFYDPFIVAKIFFMTVAMFAGLSLFGYTTGFNLSTIVKYAFAALLAVIVIGLVGMFVPQLSIFNGGALGMGMNLVGLGAVAVISAWKTQMLKSIYYGSAGNPAMASKLSAFGAASLLLSFINMFTFLMNLFGGE